MGVPLVLRTLPTNLTPIKVLKITPDLKCPSRSFVLARWRHKVDRTKHTLCVDKDVFTLDHQYLIEVYICKLKYQRADPTMSSSSSSESEDEIMG